MTLLVSLTLAIQSRREFLLLAAQQNTTCYRLFHGTVEGAQGLNIDRYGDTWLIQSFHQPLSATQISQISPLLTEVCDLPVVYHDRSHTNSRIQNPDHQHDDINASKTSVMYENGIAFTSKLRHEGQDPLLFLDMRIGREYVRQHSQNKTVLNLFSYTCGIGTAAAVGGASKVTNVDFSSFALDAGRKNAQLNHVESQCEFIQSDAFPALRQLAGLKVGGRRNQRMPKYPKLSATQYDLVFLDPPRYAKSPFGIVDLISDYQGLFKPALLTTKVGGTIVCCNNVAKVDKQIWFEQLVRCVEKQGRSVSQHQWLNCHQDFPSFDGNHPLKIVALTLD
ncbi:class I SAM-dependent rRNA methyltransferase [Shewanella intestini]|uniref:Class I SAM-dependent rRNA methyltransferase n=1 Tax=Shewanella intestini TaxID=2017544 RepID=A0ABS5I508_9GAMM|nr:MULTISPECIES: class I SAM-dependent methyltransferase [Shewanella]MBR9728390.1 class I SAM-dependent rRNA methyltransferase [Shewanella intestini]MRG36732.1 class I SAM-dependent rRNA methyltransferase [Shewanella sp. XMDDZSB0408]